MAKWCQFVSIEFQNEFNFKTQINFHLEITRNSVLWYYLVVSNTNFI